LQLIEQNLCFLYIVRVESFGEPSMDGREKGERFIAPALTDPKRGKVFRSSQFKGSSVLASCCRQRPVEQRLRMGLAARRAAEEQCACL
jgi:hypothetical protein